jgi:hypothetical protein
VPVDAGPEREEVLLGWWRDVSCVAKNKIELKSL